MSWGSMRRLAAGCVAGLLSLAAAVSDGRAQQAPVQVSVGGTATVQLDGNPSTGYAWVLDGVPGIVKVDLLGYSKPQPAPGERPKLGAPQKFQALVTGVEPGSATLVFKYVRGHGGEPAKTQEVAVEVVGEAPEAGPHDPADGAPQDAMENPGEQMLDGGPGNE
jgi:predicted secreted protein